MVIKEIWPYYTLSGNWINHYGNYDYCIEDKHFLKALLFLSESQYFQTGICFSKACNKEETDMILNKFLIGKTLIPGYHSIQGVISLDPLIKEDKSPWLYVIIVMLVLFIGLALIITLFQSMKEHKVKQGRIHGRI